MYTWLSFHPTPSVIFLSDHACKISALEPPETRAEVLRARCGSVAKILSATRPALLPDESSRLYFALSELVKQLPADYPDLEFAIYMGLAHWRLPEAQRTARERVIETIIDQYFGAAPARSREIEVHLRVLRHQLLLAPDALMESCAKSHCGFLAQSTVMDPFSKTCERNANRDYLAMNAVVAQLNTSDSIKNAVFFRQAVVYTLIDPSRRASWVETVKNPRNHQALPILVQADVALARDVPAITPYHKVGAMIDILNDAAAAGIEAAPLQIDELIDSHARRLKTHSQVLYSRARNDTVEALKAGVPMGMRGIETQAVLWTIHSTELGLNARLARRRPGAARHGPANNTPAGALQNESPDMDPAHAWSVARLIRWIEGPLAERSVQGRLNRKRVVELEEQTLAQDTRAALGAGLKATGSPAVITEEEVGVAMVDALSATARFFCDDIEDLTLLAGQLGAGQGLIDRCHEMKTQLQELLGQAAEFDEEKARALLQDAEATLTELRKNMRATRSATQESRRFSARFAAALAAEPLAMGKRHGGVVDCSLKNLDWTWVEDTFNGRWLPGVDSLTVAGEPIALRPDQALALYVTGSSKSGHAFNISVHLWQRRPGRHSMPAHSDEPFPPMNTTDWFDTYIPCAVLHVPRAG